jgi:hypothetical protein
MSAPTSDSPVRLQLKCSNTEDFIERFAPNVTRGGIFLPSREPRDVGAAIRFELALEDDRVVFSGAGVVTWAKPKGLGVKFTALDPDMAPILERLLDRRQQGAETTAAKPAEPGPKANGVPAAAAPKPSGLTLEPLPKANGIAALPRAEVPASPAPATSAAPVATPAKRSSSGRVLAWSALLACIGVGVAVGRTRLGQGSTPAPAAPPAAIVPPQPPPTQAAVPPPPPPTQAAAPPAEPIAPPAVAAADPPKEAPAPAPARDPAPPSPARAGGLRVESVLVGPDYKRFTCPGATDRISLRSHTTVNVCVQIEHRPQTDHVALVWERNGAFYGKTPVEVPATRTSVHTRAHMKIGESRLGSWTVRVVSQRNVTLAETKFDIVR